MGNRIIQRDIKELIKVVVFDVEKYDLNDLKKLSDKELFDEAVKAEKEENFDYQQYQDPLFVGYPSVVVYNNLNEFQESLELEAIKTERYHVFFVAVETTYYMFEIRLYNYQYEQKRRNCKAAN